MEIKANINYALEGKFKVDIYSQDGKLIETTDWFNNFITPTGLSYLYKYKFADCFRFLSIGSDNTVNSGNANGTGPGTTGLSAPINYIRTNLDSGLNPNVTGYPGAALPLGQFTGELSGQYMGPWAYDDGNSIIESPSGPRFYRVWRVPYYTDSNGSPSILTGYSNGLQIQEFMVSPSSGQDPAGNCAFSRVRKSVLIPNNTYAYISYQLFVQTSSNGLNVFNSGTFTTGNAEVSYENSEVALWYNLSGYYRQTYHGLAWIDSMGQTFVPKYGAIMEPSCTGLDECRFYLSPDNGQFNVSSSGGAQLDPNAAYSADGLLGFFYQSPPFNGTASNDDNSFSTPDQSVVYSNLQDSSSPTSSEGVLLNSNIRLKGITPYIYNYSQAGTNDLTTVEPYDYQNYSNATPGISGFDPTSPSFGNKAIISTRGFNLPVTGMMTGRTRTLTRRHSFMPSQSFGKNTRFASLVYAYQQRGQSSNPFYPMIDCMFFDSSGQHIMAHYRQITGIYFTNRGSGILEAYTFTVPKLDMPFTHKTFQGPGTGNLYSHPAINTTS
jgi:hypothetical protein